MKQRLQKWWNDFFFTPTDGRTLAALRIIVGLGVLIESVEIYPYIDKLFGPYGYLQTQFLDFISGPSIPGLLMKLGLQADSYTLWLHAFFFFHLVCATCFMLGLGTRVFNIGLLITQSVLLSSGMYSSYGVDRYFHNLIFFLMLFPSGDRYSLDSYLKGQREELASTYAVGTRVVQLYLVMTYINAGVGKSLGYQWWNGEAIWQSLNLPMFNYGNFLWMANYPHIAQVIGLSTLFFESLYFLGVWIPKVGKFWVLAIAGMHISIAIFMGMKLFGFSLAAINIVAFLKPWTWSPAWAVRHIARPLRTRIAAIT